MEARKLIIKELKEQGLVKEIKPYTHRVPYCYRCKTKIENIPSEQWFLKMEQLAKTAKAQVKKGKIKFYPKRFEKIYFDWLENIRDWCISRQIWWGHKIPLKGQNDVLDTWFSSALWPFATLGWPQKSSDLERFYPTNVLSTARDIINLWVLRMIFSGMEFMKKPPFTTIYIHPTVLAEDGTKMSKSIGNVIDPIDLIDKYGADATRFGIIWGVTGGQDMRFVKDNIVMGKKFCNKIWNATRFVLIQVQTTNRKPQNYSLKLKTKSLISSDKKILKALDKTIKVVNKNLNNFEFGKVTHILYDFFWHDFCDKYIESAKLKVQNAKNKKEKEQAIRVLLYVLVTSLKLLHPFIPFITEEIYQTLPIKNKQKCLMVETWPK